MASLTPNQIAQLAYNAGFRGSALRMAVAVALAESSGNPNAYNPEEAANTRAGHGSRGLWQIYGTAHPEYDNAQAFNPITNAQAAYKVYREAGNRFTPWSTYNNGSAGKISQSLNLDMPSGQVVYSNQTTSGGLTGGAVGTLTGGVLGGLTGAASGATVGAGEQTADAIKQNLPNIQFSLLPENIRQGIENLDPQFVKKSIVFGFLGTLFLVVGLIMLISALTPQGAKDAAGQLALAAITKTPPLPRAKAPTPKTPPAPAPAPKAKLELKKVRKPRIKKPKASPPLRGVSPSTEIHRSTIVRPIRK